MLSVCVWSLLNISDHYLTFSFHFFDITKKPIQQQNVHRCFCQITTTAPAITLSTYILRGRLSLIFCFSIYFLLCSPVLCIVLWVVISKNGTLKFIFLQPVFVTIVCRQTIILTRTIMFLFEFINVFCLGEKALFPLFYSLPLCQNTLLPTCYWCWFEKLFVLKKTKILQTWGNTATSAVQLEADDCNQTKINKQNKWNNLQTEKWENKSKVQK